MMIEEWLLGGSMHRQISLQKSFDDFALCKALCHFILAAAVALSIRLLTIYMLHRAKGKVRKTVSILE